MKIFFDIKKIIKLYNYIDNNNQIIIELYFNIGAY